MRLPHVRSNTSRPALGRRKVEIVELNGALQFVGVLTGKKHDGCMRINPLNVGAAVR
jgi:hypothetical protein